MSGYYSNIGQVSFKGGCTELLETNNSLKSSTSDELFKFKEMYVTLSNDSNFKVLNDYYFDFSIRAFENFDTTIEIQLVDSSEEEDLNYQFLKSVVIPKRSNADDFTCHIILFPLDGQDQVKIVHSNSLMVIDEKLDFKSGIEATVHEVYELISDKTVNFGRFHLYNGEGFQEIKEFKSIPLQRSWKNDNAEKTEELNSIRIKGVFSPLADNFNSIRLKIIRTTNDYFSSEIYENGENSEIVYGRVLKLDDAKIYKLNNLIGPNSSYITETDVIHKIGIWGNHGLMFALNGEEIQIGPTGYYELDILPIKRLGIAAFLESNSKDKIGNDVLLSDDFTIDYQYQKSQTAN